MSFIEQAIATLHSTYALHYMTPPPIIADLLPENDKKINVDAEKTMFMESSPQINHLRS